MERRSLGNTAEGVGIPSKQDNFSEEMPRLWNFHSS